MQSNGLKYKSRLLPDMNVGVSDVTKTDELQEGDVYINMQLTDKDLYSKDHFEAVKAIIDKHDDVSHIVSDVFLHSFNSNKDNILKFNEDIDEKELNKELFIGTCVVSKIEYELEDVDIIASNILLKINSFLKHFIQYN